MTVARIRGVVYITWITPFIDYSMYVGVGVGYGLGQVAYSERPEGVDKGFDGLQISRGH